MGVWSEIAPVIFERWSVRPIKLYSLPTANGQKVHIALEELGLDYDPCLLDMRAGEHRSGWYLDLNPFGRAPVIVDPGEDGQPTVVAETTAILLYLAEKCGRLIPADRGGRIEVIQWLSMIASNVGPSFRGEFHFGHKPDVVNEEAKRYFTAEAHAGLSAIERRLSGRDYLVGEAFTVADIQCFPVVANSAGRLEGGLGAYPNLCRYRDRLAERPAVQRGMALFRG